MLCASEERKEQSDGYGRNDDLEDLETLVNFCIFPIVFL